ncbi:hypothetical protein MMC25_001862 [Agyrium rufum]|nr:hypothetical protein [Agyrium rufum]
MSESSKTARPNYPEDLASFDFPTWKEHWHSWGETTQAYTCMEMVMRMVTRKQQKSAWPSVEKEMKGVEPRKENGPARFFVNFPGRVRCHKCQSPQIDVGGIGVLAVKKPTEFLNSGDSDVSPDNTPSQFLMIRGLEPSAIEDLVAKGVAKLYKPGDREPNAATTSRKGNAKVSSTTGDANLGAREGSLRRVLLVRDRRSNESWRYAFAEFATVDDAQAAMTRFNSFEKFTISSKPVMIDYIHAGVFIPVFNMTPAIERFTFSPLTNPAMKLAYWDEDAYACELVVSIADDEKKAQASKGKPRKNFDVAAANAIAKEGLLPVSEELDAKNKKRKAESIAASKPKKTVPAHLQFWSNRHAELYGGNASKEEVNQDDKEPSPGDHDDKSRDGDNHPPSYSDPVKMCCYLCSRQFKTSVEVNKHERLSDLHRNNAKNEELRMKAAAKMEKAGISLTYHGENDGSKYRDRAKERQAAFGGGKRVSLPLKKTVSSDNSGAKEEKEETAATTQSRGASLLGKMGWSIGEGLGAQGTGRVAPIATEMYVPGMGLGAEGGKIGDATEEADRNTKGNYNDFLEKTKDKAKERFARLG